MDAEERVALELERDGKASKGGIDAAAIPRASAARMSNR